MQFSLPANQLTEWINAVASGNLTAPMKHAPGSNLLALMTAQYHAAFIYVVEILNIITVALSLWILRLLMNKRAMTRQQVKE